MLSCPAPGNAQLHFDSGYTLTSSIVPRTPVIPCPEAPDMNQTLVLVF